MSHNGHHTPTQAAVTIREALPADAEAMRRLAQRDTARVPAGEAVVAQVEGELRAALSLADGAVIADPFHRTAQLVSMLRLHASGIARPAAAPATRSAARRREVAAQTA